MKRIRCKSGLMGWVAKLQKTYNNDFAEFKNYCSLYNIHGRLGFRSMKNAWETNPTICGSTEPTDISVIYFHAVLNNRGKQRIKEAFTPFVFKVKNSKFASLTKEKTQAHIDEQNSWEAGFD